MEVIKREFKVSSRSQFIEFVFVGDVHIASKSFDKNCFVRVIEYIKKSPNTYWIGMGDYSECIAMSDVRFDVDVLRDEYRENLTSYFQQEARELKEYFYPISNKAIVLLDGNHEDLLRRRYQYYLTEELVNFLNEHSKEKVYNGRSFAYLRTIFNMKGLKKVVDFVLTHGYGTARTAGAKINKLEEMRRIFPFADVYVMGHQHRLLVTKPVSLFVNRGLRVQEKVQHLIGVPSFFRVYAEDVSSYAEKKMFEPSSLGCVRLRIYPFKHTSHIDDEAVIEVII